MSTKSPGISRWTPPFALYACTVFLLYATAAFLFWGLVSHRIPLLPLWGWVIFVVGLLGLGFVVWRHRDKDLLEREARVVDVDQRETGVVEREDAVTVRERQAEEKERQNVGWERRLRGEEQEREARRLAEIGTLQDRHEPKHEWFLKAMHWYENNRPGNDERLKAYVARNIYKFLNEPFQTRVERDYLFRGDLLFTVSGRESLAIYARDHWKEELIRPFHIGEIYAMITEYWEFDYKCVLLAREMGEELKDVPEKLARHYYPEAEGLYFKDKEEAQRRLRMKVEHAARTCVEDFMDLRRRDVPREKAEEEALASYRSATLAYQEAADDQQVELNVPEDPLVEVRVAG